MVTNHSNGQICFSWFSVGRVLLLLLVLQDGSFQFTVCLDNLSFFVRLKRQQIIATGAC